MSQLKNIASNVYTVFTLIFLLTSLFLITSFYYDRTQIFSDNYQITATSSYRTKFPRETLTITNKGRLTLNNIQLNNEFNILMINGIFKNPIEVAIYYENLNTPTVSELVNNNKLNQSQTIFFELDRSRNINYITMNSKEDLKIFELDIIQKSRVNLEMFKYSNTNYIPYSDFLYQKGIKSEKIKTIILILTFFILLLNYRKILVLKYLKYCLILLSIISIFAHYNFLQMHYSRFIHYHDFIHYFIGAKYFDSVRYDNFYPCLLEAKREIAGQNEITEKIRIFPSRRLSNIHPSNCDKTAFKSTHKWEDFKFEISTLTANISETEFANLTSDFGLNNPPFWYMYAGKIANFFGKSLESYKQATLIDNLLLLISFVLISTYFGIIKGCLVCIIFCCNPIASFKWTGNSFLRYDWFFLISLSLVLAKNKKILTSYTLLMACSILKVFSLLLLIPYILDFFKKNLILKVSFASILSIISMFGLSYLIDPQFFNTLYFFIFNLFNHTRNNGSNEISIYRIFPVYIIPFLIIPCIFYFIRNINKSDKIYEKILISFPLLIFIPISNYYYSIICFWGLWKNSKPLLLLATLLILIVASFLPEGGSLSYREISIYWSLLLIVLFAISLLPFKRACKIFNLYF
jgi:hypothetical protein